VRAERRPRATITPGDAGDRAERAQSCQDGMCWHIVVSVPQVPGRQRLHPWFMIGGGMACSAAVFSGLLALSGPFATQFEWALEGLAGGFAVLGFFACLVAALDRTLRLGPLVFASCLAVLGLIGVVGSFWLPGRGFPGTPGYRAHWGYIFFSVLSGCWYMLIFGIAGLFRNRKRSAG
jgi:hypothetical protein